MERSVVIRNTEITFSIWDLGGNYRQCGQQEYIFSLQYIARPKGVCEHVTAGVQRCSRYSLYV